jgi:hypothetical protein
MNIRVFQREKDEFTIREAFNKLGISAELSDLAKQHYSEEMIDGLIEILPVVRDPIMKLELVKALCGPCPKAYERVEKVLIDEYFRSADSLNSIGVSSLLWGIGNCLEIIASPSLSNVEIYKKISNEKRFGITRQMIVLALSKFDKAKVEDLLIDLLGDEDVNGHAVIALGRIKSAKSLPWLRQLGNSPKNWIKREAKKSVRAIERNNGSGK